MCYLMMKSHQALPTVAQMPGFLIVQLPFAVKVEGDTTVSPSLGWEGSHIETGPTGDADTRPSESLWLLDARMQTDSVADIS